MRTCRFLGVDADARAEQVNFFGDCRGQILDCRFQVAGQMQIPRTSSPAPAGGSEFGRMRGPSSERRTPSEENQNRFGKRIPCGACAEGTRVRGPSTRATRYAHVAQDDSEIAEVRF